MIDSGLYDASLACEGCDLCGRTGDGPLPGCCPFGDGPAGGSAGQGAGRRRTGRAFRRKMRRRAVRKYREGESRIRGTRLDGHREDGGSVPGACIKYPKSSARKTILKRASNRNVRRDRGFSLRGNGYRRVFDYRWELC